MNWKTIRDDLPKHLVLIFAGLLTFYPFIFEIQTSFKTSFQFMHDFWLPTWPPELLNYKDAFTQIWPYLINSFIVSGTTVILVLILASLSAFTFARFDFPGREFLFMAILGLLMIPGILTLVPSFLLIRDLKLIGTRNAMILPYLSGGQVFAIFIMRSFIASLPEELFEAARIDGAGNLMMFFRIVLPLSKPILVTIAVMNILGTWNDYIWPLITLPDSRLWTITVGIVAFTGHFQGLEAWGQMFAGYVIASVPLIILFLFTMRAFISGLTSGAIKA
jgi:multiple sugar transport system permease protein/raffinose/stachyose/melibiose transport system permease protein